MAEDTQRTEAQLQEEMARAVPHELPGTLQEGKPIDAPGMPAEVKPVVGRISSAGYVDVWDTRSHEKIPVLYYMLTAKLRQRRQDGSYCFTANDPGVLPKHGEHKCLLHADDPQRSHYDELGLPRCKKSNLINPFQVKQHMRRKHPQEFKTIEEEQKEKERQEDRYFQQFLTARFIKEEETPQPK